LRSSAIKHTKDIIIKYLKAYLRNYNNYKHYCNKDYSNVNVYDKEPNDLRSFPTIIISGSGGQVVAGGLSDIVQEIRHPKSNELIGYRYGGMYDFNISIDIGTRSTLDREILTDLVTMALRFQLKRYMEREGILVKDMRYGSETEIQYDSDKLYISNIQLSTFSEWYQDINLLPLEDLNVEVKMKNNNKK